MLNSQKEPRHQDPEPPAANDGRQAPPESDSATHDTWRTAIGTMELMTQNLRTYLLSRK